jgi:hypothetical protein
LPIDELLNIVRPVIYVFLVYKNRASKNANTKALKVSFIIDMIQILFSALRIWRSGRHEARAKALQGTKNESVARNYAILSEEEKSELRLRSLHSLAKYLVRDPIYGIF